MDKLRVAIAGCHRMLDTANRGHNWANGFARAPDTDRRRRVRQGRGDARGVPGRLARHVGRHAGLRRLRPDACRGRLPTSCASRHARPCTPTRSRAAASAGARGIACDKPLATSLEETDRIVSACKNGRIALAFSAGPAVVCLVSRYPEAPARRHHRGGHRRHRLRRPEPHQSRLPLVRYRPRVGRRTPRPVWTSGHVEDVSGDGPDSRRPLGPARTFLDSAGQRSPRRHDAGRPAGHVVHRVRHRRKPGHPRGGQRPVRERRGVLHAERFSKP